MKIFTTEQIKSIDAFTIEHEPIESINLMERAATALFNWFRSKYHTNIKLKIFCGPGNNGGDGLALARLLTNVGYSTCCYYLKSDSYSPDFTINLNRLKQISKAVYAITQTTDFPNLSPNELIVDAIFGSGLNRPADGLAAELINHINSSPAETISLDIPSGLFGEANPFPNSNPVIKADICLSLQFPKLSFLMPENEDFVRNWTILPIGLHPTAIENTPTPYSYTTSNCINPALLRNSHFAHKGNFGNALIMAGSYGMMGAACLCARATIRSGAGLVTMHIPRIGYNIAQTSVPEALVSTDSHDEIITQLPQTEKYNSICIGPGMGTSEATAVVLEKLIGNFSKNLVIDADALNILAHKPNLLSKLKPETILTPHPGEFDRLFGSSCCNWERLELAIKMAKQHGVIIVLKGAYTRVVLPNGNVHFNSTGNPGMATGGSGDVLSGIITGLLARGLRPADAAIFGVYIHGLAGDIATSDFGQISLCATDIIDYICKAFQHIKKDED